MARTRRTQEQWLAIHKDWELSGLSAPVYCREAGVGYQSFQNFRNRLKSNQQQAAVKAPPQSQPTFIDLGQLSSKAGGPEYGWNICLRLGNGVELELSQQR